MVQSFVNQQTISLLVDKLKCRGIEDIVARQIALDVMQLTDLRMQYVDVVNYNNGFLILSDKISIVTLKIKKGISDIISDTPQESDLPYFIKHDTSRTKGISDIISDTPQESDLPHFIKHDTSRTKGCDTSGNDLFFKSHRGPVFKSTRAGGEKSNSCGHHLRVIQGGKEAV